LLCARARKVTASFNKTPLRDVCAALTRDAGVTISCQIVFLDKPVTLTVKDEPLGKVLEAIAEQVGAKVQPRTGGLRFRTGAH